jgi:hypothetical protein
VYFNGYNGNDYFVNDTALSAIADGMAGIDTLYGGFGPDTLYPIFPR